MQSHRAVLPGCGRRRRRRLGLRLSDPVRRAQGRAAHGERRQDRAGRARASRGQPEVAPRRRSKTRSRKSRSATRSEKRVPLSVRIAQAGLNWSKRQFFIICVPIGSASSCSSPASSAAPACSPALALGFAGAFGLPRWLLSFLKKRREAKFLDALSRRGRHHRARRQGRPAAARLPEDDHRRSAGAGEVGIPRHRRDAGRSACRSARPAASSTSACRCRRRISSASSSSIQQKAGGNLVRSARQPVARAARPQEDEGQDPGDVAGGEGLRRHHRRAAGRRDDRSSTSPARNTSRCCGPNRSAA